MKCGPRSSQVIQRTRDCRSTSLLLWHRRITIVAGIAFLATSNTLVACVKLLVDELALSDRAPQLHKGIAVAFGLDGHGLRRPTVAAIENCASS